MANDDKPSDTLLKFLTVFVAFLTLVLGYVNYEINSKLNTLVAQKTEVEIVHLKEAFQRDFKVKILELCVNSLRDKNPKQQEVALIAI